MNKETKTLLWKPHSESKDHPADRRRLGWYLKSSNKINVVDGNADFVYFTLSSDLPAILKSIKDDAKKIIIKNIYLIFVTLCLNKILYLLFQRSPI